jgi:Flp pilus assembly protein TadD
VDFLLQAIADDPSDIDTHLCLGLAYARLGEVEKAVDILEQAAGAAPTSAKVHYNLGVAYNMAKKLNDAREEFLKALGLDPGYAAAKSALDMLVGSTGPAEDKPQTG